MTDVNNTTKKNRKVIIILLFIFVAPLIYAIWLYNTGWRPTSTSNYGELIIPARPLAAFTLKTLEGQKFVLDDIKQKWIMIYIGSASCKKACQDNIYKMRQVHTLQAKKQPRVQRLMILTDNVGLTELQVLLNKEYPKMIVVSGSGDEVKKLVEQFRIEKGEAVVGQHRIYLMDPLGNLMMYYPQGMDGGNIHKDLKNLLRKSQIG